MALTDNKVKIQALLDGINALPEAGSGGIDTSDATATANDIEQGKTAYVNGEKITGAIEVINETASLDVDNATWNSAKGALRNGSCAQGGRLILEENVMVYLDIVGSTLGNATAADVAAGKTFTSANGLKITGTNSGSASPTLQTKSVTPSETAQTVRPDTGYDGLSSVSVGAISSTYVGSGVARQAAQTITPGTSDKTIASGLYLTGTQTIKGDSNLTAANIAKGVSIFGVTGTHEGGSTGGTCTVEIQSPSNNRVFCDFFVYNNGESWINYGMPGTGTYTVLVGTVMAMSVYYAFGGGMTYETTGQVELEHEEEYLQVFKVNGDGTITITEQESN